MSRKNVQYGSVDMAAQVNGVARLLPHRKITSIPAQAAILGSAAGRQGDRDSRYLAAAESALPRGVVGEIALAELARAATSTVHASAPKGPFARVGPAVVGHAGKNGPKSIGGRRNTRRSPISGLNHLNL